MKQEDFLWLTSNILPENVFQGNDGKIIVTLRNGITISHNYKKNNQMLITFGEDQSIYIIPSKTELEEIYKMHLTETNLNTKLRKYCDDHLTIL